MGQVYFSGPIKGQGMPTGESVWDTETGEQVEQPMFGSFGTAKAFAVEQEKIAAGELPASTAASASSSSLSILGWVVGGATLGAVGAMFIGRGWLGGALVGGAVGGGLKWAAGAGGGM